MFKRFLMVVLMASVLCVVVPVNKAVSGGLDQYFNQFTSSKLDKTSLTIANVKVGEKYYWGTWDMQNDLSFKLTNAGEVDDDAFFNFPRASIKGHNATEIDPGDPGLEPFDTSGCEKYYKYSSYGYEYYDCVGDNFYRHLGKVKGNSTYDFHGFNLPIYMAAGSTYAIDFTVGNATDSPVYAMIRVTKANGLWKVNFASFGSHGYILIYSDVNATDYSNVSSKHGFGSWSE